MDSEKQLTKAEKRLERLREFQDEIAEKAYRVVQAATEAHLYDDDIDPNIITEEELAAAGGNMREAKGKKRLIRDLKKNRSEAPTYLTTSENIIKGYEKAIANRQGSQGNTLNVAVFIQDRSSDPSLARASTYDVIEILPKDEER